MIPRLRLLTAMAVATALLVTSTAALAAPSSIIGHWSAPDTYDYDGSTTHMVISPGPGGTYRIRAWDNPSTSGCPETHLIAFIDGTATFDGTNIVKTVVASCPSEGTHGSPATHTMIYDASTDTIYDTDFNLTYSR